MGIPIIISGVGTARLTVCAGFRATAVAWTATAAGAAGAALAGCVGC